MPSNMRVLLTLYLAIQHNFNVPIGVFMATVQKLGLSFLQMLGVLGIFKAKGTEVFNEVMSRPSELVGGSVTSVTFVKCTLNSQAYGTFIANMILPWCVPIIALFFLIPFVAWSRMRMWKRNRAPIPVFRGRFGIPRVCARCRCLRVPMDDRVRY